MIHLILLDRADNHICDIRAGNPLTVPDSYKKSVTSQQAGSRDASR